MADVQDAPADELAWDLAALTAAEALTDERLKAAGMSGTARSLQPSLHLNLADVNRRLGRHADARHHLNAGLASVDSLRDDGYGIMIRDGLARINQQLDGDDLRRNG